MSVAADFFSAAKTSGMLVSFTETKPNRAVTFSPSVVTAVTAALSWIPQPGGPALSPAYTVRAVISNWSDCWTLGRYSLNAFW